MKKWNVLLNTPKGEVIRVEGDVVDMKENGMLQIVTSDGSLVARFAPGAWLMVGLEGKTSK